MTDAITAATPAPTSWKWQLRDSKGRWVEMGAKVKWLSKGRSFTGDVVGSPGPGYVTVQDGVGVRHRLPSNRITVTDAETPEAPPPPALSQGALQRATEKADSGFVPDTVLRSNRSKVRPAVPETESKEFKAPDRTPSMSHLTPNGRRAVKEINEIINTDVAPENQAEAREAVADVVAGEVAKKLPEEAQRLGPIKKVIAKATAATDKLEKFIISHERVGKLLDRAMMWADEYFSDIWGGSTGNPGIGGAFMTLGFSNPFSHPVEFVAQVGEHAHGLIDLAGQVIQLLSSGQPAVARRVRRVEVADGVV